MVIIMVLDRSFLAGKKPLFVKLEYKRNVKRQMKYNKKKKNKNKMKQEQLYLVTSFNLD
jgi:hypothetical protein